MSKVRRCDACGKETSEGRYGISDPDFIWIDVEANDDADHFDACSWACVADVALSKAARDVETQPTVLDQPNRGQDA